MKIEGAQKYFVHKLHEKDYRDGIINLMIGLEKHSEEFKTPEQLVALVHEYTELMATLRHIDQVYELTAWADFDEDDEEEYEDEEEIDEDGEDIDE